uniref:Reverse transcriptase domain-containing protein n=1 Tax=Tanacetum cinerariifolium TaxID=118510 RepID=A0A6L2L6W4_TANCI|nr:reverse transcriptase domain-containing protein [Tanacetum cinerariifolium]
MSTRSSTRNLFPSLEDPEHTIQRRTHVDPNLSNDFNMATNGNSDNQPPSEGGDLPVPDLRRMEELCQPTLNGRGGPIAPIAIQTTNFRLKNDMIQQNVLLVTQIDTIYNGLTLRHRDTINAAAGRTFMKRRPEECYDLIENMIAHHNDWDTSTQRSESSSSITSPFDPEIIAHKAEMAEINKKLMKVLQINQHVKAVTSSCETCGGPHSYNDCAATVGQTQNVYAAGAYNQAGNSYQPQGNRNLLNYRLDNYLGPPGFKHNQNRSNPNQNYQNRNQGNNHANPQGNNQGRNQFFQGASHVQNPPPAYQAWLIKHQSLLTNKEKLFELARTPLNEHCSTVLLKKLPQKLGDPGKFLILCDFSGMDECLALADLGASINLMPLSVWNKLSLPKLSPTCMTLELADRSISRPVSVVKDVSVKVLNIHFPADFVVVDFDADPRVPLILGRSFLKTWRAWIDVYEGELTFHVGNKAVTFNLDQSSRYSTHYDDELINRIDLIDVACGFTIVENEENELIPTRLVMRWRVCIDYRKLNDATRKDHVPLSFIDQMLERLAGNEYYYFLDGFSGFGTPCAIISDRGMHFCNDQLAKVMLKYGVSHRLATAYHPQTSRHVKVSSCGLKRILERTVGENHASLSDKLDDALWAFRTAFKTPIGAYENSLIYKEKTKRIHDSKIKDRVFNVGHRVLLFNSRLKIFSRKLKTCWTGPFTVTQVFPYGTVELSQTDRPNFKLNGHRLSNTLEMTYHLWLSRIFKPSPKTTEFGDGSS